MTPEQKPEWFQIADADNAASPRKVTKGLPVMALVAVAAILGVGAVVAQTPEDSPANATESVAPAVVDTTPSAAPAKTTEVVSQGSSDNGFSTEGSDDNLSIGPVPAIPAVHATNSGSKESIAPVEATTAPKAPSAPGIAKPTGGEHEGGEGKHSGEHDNGGEDD